MTESRPRLVLYPSPALIERLRERARVSGVSVSQLGCVLLDQSLVLYNFATPASSAEELGDQLGRVVESVATAGLATRVVAETAGAVEAELEPGSVAGTSGSGSSEDQAAPAEASGGKASPARRSSACPGNPGKGVRCKLCGKTH